MREQYRFGFKDIGNLTKFICPMTLDVTLFVKRHSIF